MDKKIQQLLSKNKSQCLYIIELMIINLNINCEKIIDDNNNNNSYLSIDLTFLNLPTFTIKENIIKSSKRYKNKLESDDFIAPGVSCLFTKYPNDLSNMINGNKSLKIAVYNMNINSICPEIDDIDKESICHAEINFDRCLCNEFNTMLSMYNNNNNLSDSLIEIRESYELFDTINNLCGTIELFIRISCCDKLIITQFNHDNNTLIFNNINSTNKFTCSRVLSKSEKELDDIEDLMSIKTVVGVLKLCDDLQSKIFKSTSSSIINEKRMRGGGLDYCNINSSIIPFASSNTLLSGACRTNQDNNNNNNDNDRPGCGCYGKSGIGLMKMEHGCSNKPCQGIDCLIRAFKDTQDFVDNIKVTGMSGLGLMDPIESPYFGRNRYNLPTTCSDRNEPVEKIKNNKNDVKTLFNYSNRHDVVPLMIKKTKHDGQLVVDNDDKLIERVAKNIGPCGEDLCQSKKIIHQNATIDNEMLQINSTETIPQLQSINKPVATRLNRLRRRKQVRKHYSQPYQMYLSKSKKIKPSKQVMKLVRSVANRLHFGHKSCIDIKMRVPGNMGWLWNTKNTAGEPKAQIGWKPGAISRRVWRLLEHAKIEKMDETPIERPTTPTGGKKLKTSRKHSPFLLSRSLGERGERVHDDEYHLPPVIHLHRKNGKYYITMYPVKKEFINQPELRENVPPLQFVVTKNKDECDSNATSSTGDEMEFEFSPPIADTRYSIRVIMKDVGAQANSQEIIDSINNSGQLKQKIGTKKNRIRRFEQH